MNNSGERDRDDLAATGTHDDGLAELFSFSDDSQFQHACELGRAEFVLAVYEDLAAKQATAAQHGHESDASGIGRGREPEAAVKHRPAGGFRRESRTQVAIGKRYTATQRDKLALDLKRKYEKGASIRALAEQTGRSYGYVHRVLSETGVTLRGRGGATRAKKT